MEVAIQSNKYVLSLDISVDLTTLVEVLKALEYLLQNGGNHNLVLDSVLEL